MKIYKDNKLIEQQKIYITTAESTFGKKVDGEWIDWEQAYGFSQPRKSACYDFMGNSHYTLELTNDMPMLQYQNIKAFFGITHLRSK